MLVKIKKQDELISESDTLVRGPDFCLAFIAPIPRTTTRKQQGTQIMGQSVYTQQQDFYTFSLRAQQLLWDFKGTLYHL
jgi:hypothetical protein